MGEIKSTLDLVMEKTRNLKMSSEEIQAQKHKESASRVRGLLQKLQDGLINEDQLKTDYEKLKKESGLSEDSALINEIIIRLDPHHDARKLIKILEKYCPLSATAIQTIINDYLETYILSSQKRIQRIKADLADRHSITGSAVVPNLDVDEDWQQEANGLRVRMQNRLRKEMELP